MYLTSDCFSQVVDWLSLKLKQIYFKIIVYVGSIRIYHSCKTQKHCHQTEGKHFNYALPVIPRSNLNKNKSYEISQTQSSYSLTFRFTWALKAFQEKFHDERLEYSNTNKKKSHIFSKTVTSTAVGTLNSRTGNIIYKNRKLLVKESSVPI